ncbi:hypothetical protein NLG97_g8447 [Lecanicillium saksenae]|uniref:Uncharacterized protein n=1 Tax=Lecanicillium saksenae TaxID=468837 RepID=A0ACC1QIW2_9HYPO|nr:hypothetical protein NLG97_g8447 [Lecanicillium saksenae]
MPADLPPQKATSPSSKRRWAPKVRTGCVTCRSRRIKCDETQPVCNKCEKSKRNCKYELRFLSQRDEERDAGERFALKPPTEAVPPEWDFMQAVRYFLPDITVCHPARPSEYTCVDPFGFRDRVATLPATFICLMVGTSLSNASRSRGRLMRPGEDPAFAGLWKNYARYMAAHVKYTNELIANTDVKNGAHVRKVFRYLYSLLGLDLMVDCSMWQVHLNGCFAYAQHIGGVESLMGTRAADYLVEILIRAIGFNTTTPATKQALGYHHYSEDQMKTLLNDDVSVDLPCPGDLLAVLDRITRLRIQVATSTISAAKVGATAQGLFQEIDQFDIEASLKDCPWSTELIGRCYSEVFHAAVKLYGILTLPRSAVLEAIKATGPDAYETLRMSQRKNLVQLLKKAWPEIDFFPSLQWALIVAGVAATTDDAAAEDQDYVEQSLTKILHHALSDASTFTCLVKLQLFWKSGKTEWEDCFDEPTAS